MSTLTAVATDDGHRCPMSPWPQRTHTPVGGGFAHTRPGTYCSHCSAELTRVEHGWRAKQ